jgi:hypothetical protein
MGLIALQKKKPCALNVFYLFYIFKKVVWPAAE